MTDDTSFESSKVQDKLQYWAAHLRDMGRRNRLLFFKDTKTLSIVINEPDALCIFERLVVKSKPIYAPLPTVGQKELFDEIDSDDQDSDSSRRGIDEFLSNKTIERVNHVLGNLRYRARTTREEQGFNALYIGFGVLKWQEGTGGEFCEAPLVLCIASDGIGQMPPLR